MSEDNEGLTTTDLKASICPNCDNEMRAEFSFCPSCGQERLQADGFKGFINQFLNDYFTFDSKFVGSIRPLLFSPGFLTKEYIIGHRVKYIPPLRLFIFTSIVFFLLIGLSSGPSWKSASGEVLQEQQLWDTFFSSLLPRLFFLFLPLFALIVGQLFGKKGDGFITHFLFSAHFHSFVFILGCFYWLMSRLLKSIDLVQANIFILLACLIYLIVYLFLALRRVYARSVGASIARFMGLSALYLLCIVGGAMLAMFLQLKF